MIRKSICAATALLHLGGCAFPGRLHDMAVNYNEAVASAADSVTFLNIMRARDGRPMHFTSISKLSGSITADASTSLSSGVGGETVTTTRDGMLTLTGRTVANGANTFTPGAGGKISTTPSFDVTVHDTQEFYRGILASVDISTINHFLRQGWPSDLLTYLFVEEVRIFDKGAGKPRANLENDPDDPVKAKAFSEFVKCLTLAPKTEKSASTPLFSISELERVKLGDIALLDGKTFDYVAGGKGGKIVRLGGSSHSLTLEKTADASCGKDALETKLGVSLLSLEALTSSQSDNSITASDELDGGSGQDTLVLRNGDIEIEIEFRSVQGVLYYLGEYIRAGHCPYLTTGSNGAPIFVAASSSWHSSCAGDDAQKSDSVIAASLDGARYWIPRNRAGRSLQVLTLVEQLLNLQKSADARPTTQTVRVVQ